MINHVLNPSLFILDACHYATDAHRGQFRKYTRDPYIVHPEKVASLVKCITNDPEVVAAAWLHDVVEDCGVTVGRLRTLFGDTVATLVADVTNVTTARDGARAIRKKLERIHLGAADPRAKIIKLADIMDNVPSIVTHDPGFAKTYVTEKWLLLPYLNGGDSTIWEYVRGLLYRALEYDLGIDTETIKLDGDMTCTTGRTE